MKTILVIGGAGFIGSHMVQILGKRGYRPLVLDNLSTGHESSLLNAELIHGDCRSLKTLDAVFTRHQVDAVMHFAACSRVDESMVDPYKYYENNVGGTLNLLSAMQEHGVRKLVFSSTAAVYGNASNQPIRETHSTQPVNPYGRTKLAAEGMIRDFAAAHGLRYAVLRYFNAAGCDPSGRLGERHEPETHLIPLVLQAASQRRAEIHIHGSDYPTPDGTCIRDYVHVEDLCNAHLLTLQRLLGDGESAVFNLGNGSGYSVMEVIQAVRRVTGRRFRVIEGSRRAGDPAVLLADSRLAREELGWLPRHPNIETMIAHAWHWEMANNSDDAQQPESCLRGAA